MSIFQYMFNINITCLHYETSHFLQQNTGSCFVNKILFKNYSIYWLLLNIQAFLDYKNLQDFSE